MILAASGILDGGPATTKREVVPPETSPLEVMRATYPRIDVREAMLVEGAGGVVTGGGVTLCIDTTLHLLSHHARGARRRRNRAHHGISARLARQPRGLRAGPDGPASRQASEFTAIPFRIWLHASPIFHPDWGVLTCADRP